VGIVVVAESQGADGTRQKKIGVFACEPLALDPAIERYALVVDGIFKVNAKLKIIELKPFR